MTNQQNSIDKEQMEQLEYAHRFAAEHFIQESRAFWARVTALLIVNSLLVAGFTVLYCCFRINDYLLLAIAASGIAIQSLWPVFAIYSYPINEYWGRLMKDIEKSPFLNEYTVKRGWYIEQKFIKIYTSYADSFQAEKQEAAGEKKNISRGIREVLCDLLVNGHPGAIACILFFFIFLTIWVVAVIVVEPSCLCRGLSIGLPSLVIILCSLASFNRLRKWRRNATIKAVR